MLKTTLSKQAEGIFRNGLSGPKGYQDFRERAPRGTFRDQKGSQYVEHLPLTVRFIVCVFEIGQRKSFRFLCFCFFFFLLSIGNQSNAGS